MTEIKDLTGMHFGELTILGLDTERRKRDSKRIFWIAECSCGNIISTRSDRLSSIISCGCKKKSIILPGMIFSRLTIVKEVDCPDNLTRKRRYFLCRCECGKETIARAENLKCGYVKSCGCLFQDTHEKTIKPIKESRGIGFIDLTGMSFGLLTVIKLDHYNRIAFWLCECSCGRIVVVKTSSLKSNHSRSCGQCLKDSFVASELKDYCIEKYSGIPEYKIFRNPKTNYYLPFDIYIPDNIFIEVNGWQHYARATYWQTVEEFEYLCHKDFLKKQYAEKNGIFIEIDLREIKTGAQAIKYLEERLSLLK